MEEKRKLKFILYAFALLLIVGVIGYMFLLKVDFIDALYMTVITISTVGFGEVGTTSNWSEVFSIIMIFVGVGIVGYAFTTVVAMFVEGKVKDFWKGSKMEKKIASLDDHYIICGSGELAEVIINNFIDQNLNFVVITDKREDLDDYSHHDILVVEGMSTEEAVLEHAGIERAKGLVSTLDSEVDNIVTVLTARNLNKNIYIIANAITKSGSEKLMKVGANKTLSAVEISGKRMASLMTKPNIISFLDVVTRIGDVELDLEEVVVKSGSYLENKNLIEAQIPNKTGLIVLAIKTIEDNKMIFNPPVNYTFRIGDVLIVLGREDQVDKLKHLGDETK
ncbi:MAG: potassium channel protein [Finegoldia magna]|uniref:Potassium channel protein n=1 Tax=Finegoldia magna TaxID=1260 RepID=A0A943LFN2_FINMA|nr:potassium channel protein [Finegoldia magna]MBS5360062.1 potassium channel protein [Finegoldia magna]MBS5965218.1 potassium channel protein [Finegoldia magna]MBS5970959.1 potassium channel protein [Finegoldia magna]MDU1399897.1 potassium channel protein [Finegoldia magna]MDU2897327.1 potassium channel protein [Finegoldia magna]